MSIIDKFSSGGGKFNRLNALNILNGIMDIAVLGIVFFVPVYFAFLFVNHNIFELNKTVLFNLLTTLFLTCFLLKLLFYPCFVKQEVSKEKLNFLAIPLLFLLAIVAATIFSEFKEISLFGLYSRKQGLISFVYYFIFFVLFVFHIKDSGQIKKILKTVGFSSFVVSGYGLLQALGADIFSWSEDSSASGRVISSLGQPNYLGSFLLLGMPIVWYLFHTTRKKTIKWWWFAVLLLQIVCLYFTLSRGAYLGFAAGLATGVVLYFVFVRKIYFKSTKPVIFSFVVLVLSLFLFAFTIGEKPIQKLSRGVDIEQGSVALRLNLWDKAGKAITASPFFGYGPDTQKEIFFKHYQKDWGVFADVNTVPSRAHNLILDKLLTIGFLGLFFYLVLLYFFIKLVFKIIKSGEQEDGHINNKILGIAIFIAFLSYSVSMLFHFETVATQVYFWLYLALAVAVYYNIMEAGSKKENLFSKDNNFSFFVIRIRKIARNKTGIILKILLAVFLITGFGFQFKGQLNHLLADHYYAYINKAYAKQDYFRIFELYGHIKRLNVRERHYDREVVLMVSDFIDSADSEQYKKVGFNKISPALEEIRHSLSFRDIYAKAKLYSALADKDNSSYFDKAEENFKLLFKHTPLAPKYYIFYAQMLSKKGEYSKAITNYDKASKMLPSLNDPRLNKEHLQAIKKEKYLIEKGRGETYFLQKEYEKAEISYRKALENNFSDIVLYKKIADTYYKRGELEKAIKYNEKGYLLNKKDPAWPFSIALLYKELKNEEKALMYAKQALSIAPKSKKIKNFIDKLQF
ncbi:MAG: O-antigen ligase family protein [Patescibacteria group bacterium]